MLRVLTFPLILVLVLIISSCKEDSLFEQTPTERTATSIKALREQLVTAPYGWSVLYFSRTDSLLFTNPNIHIGEFEHRPEDYGYGGHAFLMTFKENGLVEMHSDFNPKSIIEGRVSEFSVGQNSSTQLSFTTFNYLHQLVNEAWNASVDWLYQRTDSEGKLWFRTTSYPEVAREYIVMRKITSQEEKDLFLTKAYEHRRMLEQMKYPVLSIRQGDKIFFRSNYNIQHVREEVTQNKRYILFLFNKRPNPIIDRYPLEMNGLGSGYVGTEQGLTFYTGFRYNKNYIFHHFQRQGNKFVCELVKVYDPIERVEKWVSRHLYPQGQSTGIIAEIEDQAR